MSDGGAASIYAAAVGLLLALAGLGVAAQAMEIVAAAQARSAADLGALAGASLVMSGREVACERAAEIVAANGATTVSCDLDGLDLQVTAQVRSRKATARAGPIRAGG